MSSVQSSSFLASLWEDYNRALTTNPLTTKMLTSALISASAESVSRTAIQGRELDTNRVLRCAATGALIAPIIHTWHGIMDRLFAGKTGVSITILKLLLDQGFFDPLLTAIYFIVWGVLEGRSAQEIRLSLQQRWFATQKMSWRVWPLASYVMFNHIPSQYRMLFGNLVAFFWCIYLSSRTTR